MKKGQEKVTILSAFADIRGSGAYRARITNEKKQSLPFWAKFDELVDEFEVGHEYFLKHLGDGFLTAVKLNGKNGARTVRFLSELWDFYKKADRLIRRSDPGPDGFRIHVAAGDAIQTIQTSGEIVFHGYHLDLIGTTIKMDALKSLAFVVHSSARDLMSPYEIERARLRFEPVPPPELRRTSEKIYEKDMNLLSEFKKR